MPLPLFLSEQTSATPPKNTLRFIDHAVNNGFDGVYLKVQLNQQGVPYIFSEETTHELTTSGGFFSYQDDADILELSAKSERIPSLRDALARLLTKTLNRSFSVHLQAMHPQALPVMASVVQMFDFSGCNIKLLLISNHAPAILVCKKKFTQLSFALHITGVPLAYAKDAHDCLADAIYIPDAFHVKELVRDAQTKNLAVYVEGVPRRAHLPRLQDLHVDGVAGSAALKNN